MLYHLAAQISVRLPTFGFDLIARKRA